MRKSRVSVISSSFVALAMALAACSGGDGGGGSDGGGPSHLDQILEDGKITVAILQDFPPTSHVDDSGNVVGYEADIAQELADALGVELEFEAIPGDARLSSMESGRADLNISAYTTTNERARQVAFSIPYNAQGAGVLTTKDSGISSLDDLAGKTVGVARGSTNDTIVTEDFPESTPERFDDISDAIQALKSGKVDATMESYFSVHELADADDNLVALDDGPLRERFISIGVLPQDHELLEFCNNFVRWLIISGKDAELHEKWFNGMELSKKVTGQFE